MLLATCRPSTHAPNHRRSLISRAPTHQDRSVRLWNPHRGIPIKVYAGHGYEVRDVAVAGDNSK